MPLPLGYVEVRTGISTAAPARTTRPLDIVLAAPPLNEPDPGFGLMNNVDLPGGSGTDLQVAVTIKENSDTAQSLTFVLLPSGSLTDLEVRVWINTQFLTNNVDYTADPSPAAGESLLMFGYRSAAAEAMPQLLATLRVQHGTGFGARDEVTIDVASQLHQPRTYLVGQLRLATERATYTMPGFGDFRQVVEGAVDGMRVALKAHDPNTEEGTWLRIALSTPRTGDSPIQELEPAAAAGPGGLPVTGKRRYRVTWVFDNGNESGATPPSAAVQAPTGAVTVPLPVWAAAPPVGDLPAGQPLPVARRRVYRTATSATGDAGEYFLVDEVEDNVATEYVDLVPDEDLGDPLLTDIDVAVRRSADVAGTQLRAGGAVLQGSLELGSRELAVNGTPRFRGTLYSARFDAVPARADVSLTTRPAGGRPRVEWRTRDPAGPAGVGGVALELQPQGVAVGVDRPLRAEVESVPPEIGIDWWLWGATRIRVAAGRPDDVNQPLATPARLVAFHTAPVLTGRFVGTARAVGVFLDDDATRASVRGLRRLRLLVGLPRPAGELGTRNAQLDDGVAVNLHLGPPERGRRERSLVFRRRVPGGDLRRVEVRAGALADQTLLDLKPSVPTTGLVQGRILRLAAFLQGPEDETRPLLESARHDGIWVACPDTGGNVELVIDTGRSRFELVPERVVRVDAAVRRPGGLGAGDPVLRGVQATVSLAGKTTVAFPPPGDAEDAKQVAVAGKGASGRVGLASPLAADGRDPFRAVRATPQAMADFSSAEPGAANLQRATFRVLGLVQLDIARGPAPGPHRLVLAPARANQAFRAGLVVTDGRFDPATWALVKLRLAAVPSEATISADMTARAFVVDLSQRSGEVVLFAEPAILAGKGPDAAGIGVGLAKATVEALPTHLELDLLGPPNTRQDEPFNWSPPAGWRKSGFRLGTDGEIVVRALQLIGIDRTRPATDDDALKHYWGNTAAAFVKVAAEEGDGKTPGPVWLWTPAEGLPSASADAGDWEDDEIESALGFQIEEDSLMTLQLNNYIGDSGEQTPPRRWNASAFSWLLKAEFQMLDYRGEGTLTPGSLSPTGNPDAGPGLWYLRLPDAAPFGGQVVFGNTGGWVSSRPAIFESFTP